jgi:hypothetical protein
MSESTIVITMVPADRTDGDLKSGVTFLGPTDVLPKDVSEALPRVNAFRDKMSDAGWAVVVLFSISEGEADD